MVTRRASRAPSSSTADLLRRFRRAIAPRTSFRRSDFLPTIFFHYTTAAGLEGIVRQGSLRATNFSFMNDPSELQYGRDLIQEVLSDRLNAAEGDKETFLEYTGINFNSEMLSEVYVCCFTKLEDDLSQWRAYGGNVAERYAVGFDAEEIQSLASRDENTFLARVNYDLDRQVERISDVLDKGITFVQEHRPRAADLIKFGEAAAARLARIAPSFKTPAYEPESEWRIVHWGKANDKLRPRFDAARGVLRPYIEIDLPKELPITALYVLAPRRRDLAMKAAAMLLESASVRIYPMHSSIPFAD